MTKKDYELIAGAIKDRRDIISAWGTDSIHPMPSAEVKALDDVAQALAGRLSDENPRFNAKKFLTACGVKE